MVLSPYLCLAPNIYSSIIISILGYLPRLGDDTQPIIRYLAGVGKSQAKIREKKKKQMPKEKKNEIK